MSKGIEDQLGGLERDQRRLEALLRPNENWRIYQKALSNQRGTADRSDNATELISTSDLSNGVMEALERNPLFTARAKVLEARHLLQELIDSEVCRSDGEDNESASTQHNDASDTKTQIPPGSGSSGELSLPAEAFRTKVNVKSAQEEPVAELEVTELETALEAGIEPESKNTDYPLSATQGLLAFLALGGGSSLPLSHTAPENVPANPVAPASLNPTVLPTLDVASALPTLEAARTAIVPKPANDDAPGRLEQIQGLTSKQRGILLAQGVSRCSDIALWTRADVKLYSSLLGADTAISRHQWIEQAAILATGRQTAFAKRLDGGDAMALVTPPRNEVWTRTPPPVGISIPSEIPNPVETASPAVPVSSPAKPEPRRFWAVQALRDRAFLYQAKKKQTALNKRITRLEKTVDTLGPSDPHQTASTSDTSTVPGANSRRYRYGLHMPFLKGASANRTSNEADVKIIIGHRIPSAAKTDDATIQTPEDKNDSSLPLVATAVDFSTDTGSQSTFKSLAERLSGHKRDEQAFDVDHAAYQGVVEEASVQIIKTKPSVTEDAAVTAPRKAPKGDPKNASESENPLESEATPDAESGASQENATEKRGVGTFLRALTGD